MDQVFSFLLWPKREARGPWKQGRKKRGSITCRTDRANEANKMFIIWLWWLFRFWKGDRELEVRTATYGPGIDLSQHAKSFSHIIKILKSESNSCILYVFRILFGLYVQWTNELLESGDESTWLYMDCIFCIERQSLLVLFGRLTRKYKREFYDDKFNIII